ncbi:hypothetical protein Ancab_024776 [Ancistrocladus abbreviatus]
MLGIPATKPHMHLIKDGMVGSSDYSLMDNWDFEISPLKLEVEEKPRRFTDTQNVTVAYRYFALLKILVTEEEAKARQNDQLVKAVKADIATSYLGMASTSSSILTTSTTPRHRSQFTPQ